MKKTLLISLFSFAAIAAGAQTAQDAYTFSQNTYYGTARSIGMGNAVTAVGGDLGTIGFNPAGSAVMGYSQFTITPGISFGSTSNSYSPYGDGKFSNENNSSISRFNIPNFGAVINFNLGNDRGLKSISYGVVMNSTNKFLNKIVGGGMNDKSSYLGAMSVLAEGFNSGFLNGYLDANGSSIDDGDYPYYHGDDRGYYAPWTSIVNAQAGAISNYGDSNDPAYVYRYIGATEVFTPTDEYDKDGNRIYNVHIGGPLNQTYGRKVTGSKDDIVFNVGFNISDVFYFGANLGITTIDYNYHEYFKEYAQSPSDFPIVLTDNNGNNYTINFDNYRARYSYSMDATGVYGKFGFIARPGGGLRLGAAIQTPTLFDVHEKWQNAADVHYSDRGNDGSAYSPEGDFDYKLRSPYIFNAGLAYTFAGMAMISADYELTDYSLMKFKNNNNHEYDNDTFDAVNSSIKDLMGKSHTLRLGAEVKPAADIAIRAGYNYTTTPIGQYISDTGKETATSHHKLNAFSVGLGYSSPGSFFCDLAGRLTSYSNEYISPYINYLSDADSPLLKSSRDRWDVVLTLGWRF